MPSYLLVPTTTCTGLTRERPLLDGSMIGLAMFALAMIIMMTFTMRSGSAYYYFYYYVERPELLPDYLLWQMTF